MESKDTSKRSRRLVSGGMIVFLLVARLMLALSRNGSPQTRGPWLLGGFAVLMFPFGFMYGRNAARKDKIGKTARAIAFFSALGTFVGFMVGGPWIMLCGLGGGFLMGFALGSAVRKRVEERLGDTAEAEEYLNPVRSRREPPRERPSESYVKSLDPPARKAIGTLKAVEAMSIFAAMGLGIWLVFADCLDALSRAIYTRAGDGTVVFITSDPIIVGVPLILIGICVAGLLCERLLPVLAGPHRDAWREFLRLRNSSCTTLYLVVMAVLVLVLVGFVDSYVKVTKDGIAINRFLGLGAKFHAWRDVTSAELSQQPYYCKNHHLHQRRRVRVVFDDGSEWNPDTSFASRLPDIEKAVRYVAAHKSGRRW